MILRFPENIRHCAYLQFSPRSSWLESGSKSCILAENILFGRCAGSSRPGSGSKSLLLAEKVLFGRCPGSSQPGFGFKSLFLAEKVLFGRCPGSSRPGSGSKSPFEPRKSSSEGHPGIPHLFEEFPGSFHLGSGPNTNVKHCV